MMRAAMLLALLAGCGWSSAWSTPAPARECCGATAPQPAEADAGAKLPTIMIDGDSITYRWATTGAGNWPAGTQNFGIGSKYACAYYRDVLMPGAWWAGTAYLHIGVVDIANGATADQTWACQQAIINQWRIEWPLMRVRIIATLPVGSAYADCNTEAPILAQLRALQLASDYDVIDTTAAMTCGETCGGAPALCSSLTADGIHLVDAAAYATWYAAINP